MWCLFSMVIHTFFSSNSPRFVKNRLSSILYASNANDNVTQNDICTFRNHIEFVRRESKSWNELISFCYNEHVNIDNIITSFFSPERIFNLAHLLVLFTFLNDIKCETNIVDNVLQHLCDTHLTLCKQYLYLYDMNKCFKLDNVK